VVWQAAVHASLPPEELIKRHSHETETARDLQLATREASEPHAAPPPPSQPRVFLHIGEPKTGTTFLQQVMWRNRRELAAYGVVLPGHHPQDHFRASQDLRGIQKLDSDPAGCWTGEWDILAAEARQARQIAVISHELFSAVDATQAERAVASLQPAEVHVVITVRDIATLLPAEWQETVKHRSTRGWQEWLSDVIDTESVAPDRRQWWFWRVHDTVAILDIWSRYVPPERVHVITTPPRGSDQALLWRRLSSLLGIDPGCADIARARQNTSLGLAEVEFLRRLNSELPEEVPNWFYMWNVKEGLAHRALAARPSDGRLALPPSRDAWAAATAETLVTALKDSAYHIAGDLAELMPPQVSEASGPASPPDGRVLDAAVAAAAALVVNQYRKEYPAAKPQRGPGDPAGGRGLVSRVEATVGASPRLKRAVRDLSSRFPAIRRLRILAWQIMQRRRAGRPSAE
jgi:hypothetical protein